MSARTAAAALRVEPLRRQHDRSTFACGAPELDAYLREQAGQDVRRHVAACYVLVERDQPLIVRGYYTLSTYAIELRDLPADTARRLPRYPRVPAALLGRLAVDQRHRRRHLGEFLLVDALRRTLAIAGDIGLHALVTDARDAEAARFYLRYGFIPVPTEPLRLFLPMQTIEAAFARR